MSEQKSFTPKLVGFLCNWCSYAGSDLAGTSRIHHDISVRAIRVMCSGRVEPAFVIKAFADGADGVIIAGCHIPADCHYTNGNFKALARYETFLPLLDELGIERERLQLHWISASEGEKFAQVMNDFSATVKKLGPLDLEKIKLCRRKETCAGLSSAPEPFAGQSPAAGPFAGQSPSAGPFDGQSPAAEPLAAPAADKADGAFAECPVIRKSQEFAACEAASSGMIDLEKRKAFDMALRVMEPSIVFDPNKCIRCGSCVEACNLQGIEAIRMDEKEGVVIDESKCCRCRQCVLSCPLSFPDKTIKHVRDMLDCNMCPYAMPAGAVSEKDDTALVVDALKNGNKYLVLQIAPSVRITIGEEFGIDTGGQTIKKLYSAFRKMGFDKVGDTNFSADLTIMEEGNEFLGRVSGGGTLPLFTSCCPAWVKFVETNYPGLVPHLSTAKSPQQMFGATVKTAAAKQLGIDPSNMFVVSIMPCTAKKFERARKEFSSAFRYWKDEASHDTPHNAAAEDGRDRGSYPDVDAALTTRECAKLLKLFNINLSCMPESASDDLMGEYTGAAAIFGRTGGVMTAALRTAYEIAAGQALPDIELSGLGSPEGIKTAEVRAGDKLLKVAVVSGLQNARKICEDIVKGGEFSKYHFIEVMSCPGGCVGGGGQIISTNKTKVAARTGALNNEDKSLGTRKSHENALINSLYEKFYGKPCSELAHKLLHTHYFPGDAGSGGAGQGEARNTGAGRQS